MKCHSRPLLPLSWVVRRQEGLRVAEALDWGKLPGGLGWLAAPAERYGRLRFDGPILDFLHAAPAAELAELRALQRRWMVADTTIEAWLDAYPITEHPEAALVFFTMKVLGFADDGFFQQAGV